MPDGEGLLDGRAALEPEPELEDEDEDGDFFFGEEEDEGVVVGLDATGFLGDMPEAAGDGFLFDEEDEDEETGFFIEVAEVGGGEVADFVGFFAEGEGEGEGGKAIDSILYPVGE